MIIKIIIPYLFAIFLCLSNTLAISNDKIVYINVDFILQNSNSGKIIIKELKEINSQNLKKISIFEKEIKKEDNEIKKVRNIISEDEFNKKISMLNKKISNYKLLKKDLSNKKVKIFLK